MPRDLHVDAHVRPAFHVNDLHAMFGLQPSGRRLIRALRVEVFDVHVGHGRADIRESPRNSLVVADNHKGHPRQRDASNIERARSEVRLVPEIRHLVAQVHIVAKQRLAGHRVRAGYNPVVRSIRWQAFFW